MSTHHAKGLAGFSCLKCGGRRAKLLEQCDIPAFVVDLVALEHDAPFELPGGVVRGKFTVFLDANLEDASYVCFCFFAAGLGGHVRPLTDLGFVPASSLS